jgi:hypothetical protein
MTRTEHLLTILAEECGETAQRATKALRFGLNEVQPGQELNNAERIVYEFNDILSIMNMLVEEGKLPRVEDKGMMGLKKDKVEKYLIYSKEQGLLEE